MATLAHGCAADLYAWKQASDDEDNAEDSDVLNCAARGDPMKEFNKTSRFNRIFMWTLVRAPVPRQARRALTAPPTAARATCLSACVPACPPRLPPPACPTYQQRRACRAPQVACTAPSVACASSPSRLRLSYNEHTARAADAESSHRAAD